MIGAGANGRHPRQPIRSYVLRAGRITRAQRRALDELMPRYGLPFTPRTLDLDAVFGRHAPRVLEIGFGNGNTLLELAGREPATDFMGVEVHPPGIGHCLLGIEMQALANVRLIAHDAVEVLGAQIPPGGLDEILLYFPDPWPKKRHRKRRMVQPGFAALAARKLAPGGLLHAATDWPDYAEHMREVFSQETLLEPAAAGFAARPVTKFESRGRRLGHAVRDLVFRRKIE